MRISDWSSDVCSSDLWILRNFGPVFTISSVLFLALLAAIALSPFGRTTIGGPDAKPLLDRWRWFAVTLCTTIATGILFWGVAEPLFHPNEPRSEERRVGKEWCSSCRSRWSP